MRLADFARRHRIQGDLSPAGAGADTDLADVAWSLATTRSVFGHRAVVSGADRESLIAGLAALAAGQPADAVVSGSVATGGRPTRVVTCAACRGVGSRAGSKTTRYVRPGSKGNSGVNVTLVSVIW